MSQEFNLRVEIGRVVLINYGPDAGKLAVIIDILDQNRALIDGPFKATGVQRQVLGFRRMELTSIKIDINRNIREGGLVKAFEAAKVLEQWAATKKAQKIAREEKLAGLNDFERFKYHHALRERDSFVRKQLGQLKAVAK